MQRKIMEGVSGALPRASAEAILGTIATGLTAAGTLQTDALALTKATSVLSTVAIGAGAILERGLEIGDEAIVVNLGANACLVYPPVGGAIQTGATNAAFSVGVGKTACFKKVSTTLFVAVLSA